MNKVTVRCWEQSIYDSSEDGATQIFITYPVDNIGYDLIICNYCGEIYAIDISKETYIGPSRQEKLNEKKCMCCSNNLSRTAVSYPENYKTKNGKLKKFYRSLEMPDESKAITKEFYSIY